jgi:hypothetical protein
VSTFCTPTYVTVLVRPEYVECGPRLDPRPAAHGHTETRRVRASIRRGESG